MRPDLLNDLVFLTWEYSARCVISLFYKHSEDGSILCPECYHFQAPSDKHRYRGVFRHYIHFGSPARWEECDACCVLIATPRVLPSCDTCLQVKSDFLEYIFQRGDDPWNAPESTIVGVDTIHL